jgi:hypothetical protein
MEEIEEPVGYDDLSPSAPSFVEQFVKAVTG